MTIGPANDQRFESRSQVY